MKRKPRTEPREEDLEAWGYAVDLVLWGEDPELEEVWESE